RLLCEAVHTSMEAGAWGTVILTEVACGRAGAIHNVRVVESGRRPEAGTCECPKCAHGASGVATTGSHEPTDRCRRCEASAERTQSRRCPHALTRKSMRSRIPDGRLGEGVVDWKWLAQRGYTRPQQKHVF